MIDIVRDRSVRLHFCDLERKRKGMIQLLTAFNRKARLSQNLMEVPPNHARDTSLIR